MNIDERLLNVFMNYSGMFLNKNEMNRALGQLCAHIG